MTQQHKHVGAYDPLPARAVPNTPPVADRLTDESQAQEAVEAALMAPSTFRTEWRSTDDSYYPPVTFTVTEPGARISALVGPDLEEDLTCLVVQTQTTKPDGSIDTAYYATDFGTMVALPAYNPHTQRFGVKGEPVRAMRSGRKGHYDPNSRDIVVNQPLFGVEGESIVVSVVIPEAAMGTSDLFRRVRYTGDLSGLAIRHSAHRDNAVGISATREMPLRKRDEICPLESAYEHLTRIKAHYDGIESGGVRGISGGPGAARAAITGA